MATAEEIFLLVFQEVKFPFLSIDLKILANTILKHQNEAPKSHVDISLKVNFKKRDFLINSLRGIIRKIEVPQECLKIFESSPFLKEALINDNNLKTIVESPQPFFAITSKEYLRWDEGSYWPVAYNQILGQFINLVLFFDYAMNGRETELSKFESKPEFFSEYPRMAPTAFHYAAASLGAWIGGASNMPYFSYYATTPQLRDDKINESYLQKIDYIPLDARELSQSGILGLPASLVFPLMTAQGGSNIFGSLAIDEWNIANLPQKELFGQTFEGAFNENQLPGFIIDKYYRTPFTARQIKNQGLLGERTVLRDHYTDFYAQLGNRPLIRCKHYCAPIIEVSSISEIEQYIKEIPLRDEAGIFFRGQTSMYTLKRTDKVKKMLFGNSCNLEPSLVTAAARTKFDYDSLHFALKYFLTECLEYDSSYRFSDADQIIYEKSKSPMLEIDHAIIAMAQHYGIPSHGLDITKDIDVAMWFATNKYFADDSGFAEYNKLTQVDWDTRESMNWPVIFACQAVTNTTKSSLHDCHELTEVGITALRPERQKARFFLGGHSEHQNRLAETVICAFRLKPGDYKTKVDFDYLFPSPTEDRAYSFMLDFAANETFKKMGSEKVNRFHK